MLFTKSITKIVAFWALFYGNQLYATHFSGGELTYRSLGNNKLEMHLKFYRDCNDGTIPQDPFAIIGAFDFNNNFIQADTLSLQSTTNLPITLDEPCVHLSPLALCYEIVHYSDTIEINPPSSGGIVFAYERCCLPLTLTNIDNPVGSGGGTVGIILSTIISDVSFINNNSSSTVINDSNVVICLGLDFEFDQSCFDPDGDSLEYKLITPYSTTTTGGVSNPSAPPYLPLTYMSGFSLSNVLGSSNSALAISVDSGLLMGNPSSLGQYLYGVRTREFRNGTPVGFVDRAFVLNTVVSDDSIVSVKSNNENQRLEDNIRIYPNPSNMNYVRLEMPHADIRVKILDVSGRIIHNELLSNGENEISTDSWLPGMYSLQFEFQNQITWKKYIKLE